MTIERIQWVCPVCNRRYAIPASAPTPTQCPQCRQAEEEAARLVSTDSTTHEEDRADNPLAALAAIQMEVVEEATRGLSPSAPISRREHPTLGPIMVAYSVLSGLAVLGSFAALLFGLKTAFVMEATPARTATIFYSIAAFVGGLVGALTFFMFREMIRVILDIEEATRPK